MGGGGGFGGFIILLSSPEKTRQTTINEPAITSIHIRCRLNAASFGEI
jgi:hypothetical protein